MAAGQPAKALPTQNPDTARFWEGCASGQLLLQRCSACGAFRHPPSPVCPECFSSQHEWLAASGKGTVYSFVVVHQAFDRAWEGDVPYVVAIIELDEGPHIMTNVVEAAPDTVEIGMPVRICFEQASNEIALPKFQPVAG